MSRLDDLKIDRDARPRGTSRGYLWWLLPLIVLGGVAVWWFLLRPEPKPTVEVAIARRVETGASQTVLNASGYVTARRQATVSAKSTGKIVEVLIEEGMAVEEGQVLARLDQVNLRESLALAEARVPAARAAVRESEVLLDEAAKNLARTRKLVEQAVATPFDLDRDQARFDAEEARLERLRLQVLVDEREVSVTKQLIEDTIIRAPFGGVVVTKDAQPGEMISPVSAGGGFTRTGIGTVVDMSSLEIEVDVNESYINRVRADQPVEAVLDAYPDWKLPAHVIAIVPTADRQKATVRVRIGFETGDPRILPDMGVKVAFREIGQVTPSETRVMVPEKAVRQDGGRSVVFLVEDGVLERRAVSVGATYDKQIAITAGLRGGERIMVEGPPGPSDGMAVEEVVR